MTSLTTAVVNASSSSATSATSLPTFSYPSTAVATLTTSLTDGIKTSGATLTTSVTATQTVFLNGTPTATRIEPASTTATLIVALPTSVLPSITSSLNATIISSPSSDDSHTGSISHPNEEQIQMIWIAVVMLACILVSWNMIILRSILYPWKMLINLIHELFHILAGILTGAKIYSVTIDPDKGPISGMTGGVPLLVLLCGYLGSIVVGSSMIMLAFDTKSSKIVWLTTVPLFVVCFWFGRWWARMRVALAVGVSVAFWWIDHGIVMRYYILFIGVMCAFYVLWDALDDVIFRKENESDAALLARLSPPTIHAWFLLWFLVTLGFVALGIVGALHFFDKSLDAQRLDQATFLPT